MSKPLYELPKNWSWHRPKPKAPRPASRQLKRECSKASSPFYGYQAEIVAKVCCVSVKTARAWKAGTQKPSPAALELFQLRTTGQVIPEEFKGYYFSKGKLFPSGRLGFTPAHIEAYELIYKIATTYARPEVEAHLERMELAMRETPPEAGTALPLLPRWVWDPFFNPLEGARTVLAGTDLDRKD